MHLAMSALFKAKWSEDIHEEWIENLLEKRPEIGRKKLENTKRLMEIAVPDALVDKMRYQPLISNLNLPDKNDRHVLATAIAAQAQLIVTFNLKDFPPCSMNSKKFSMSSMMPVGLLRVG